MTTSTSRRAVLAGAATLPALAVPALAETSSHTAHLERLVAGYYEASARWAPLMLAAHEATDAAAGGKDWFGPRLGEAESKRVHQLFNATMRENGCDAAQDVLTVFHGAIEEIEGDVLDAPTRTIDDLWAKALIALFRSAPVGAGFDFSWEEPEYEALVRAVAELAGRSAFLDAIEASVRTQKT
jgi:hypothetical protein